MSLPGVPRPASSLQQPSRVALSAPKLFFSFRALFSASSTVPCHSPSLYCSTLLASQMDGRASVLGGFPLHLDMYMGDFYFRHRLLKDWTARSHAHARRRAAPLDLRRVVPWAPAGTGACLRERAGRKKPPTAIRSQ